MASIIFYPQNILEGSSATITVTGDPDTGYPESRLYDRCISNYWKDTVTEAKTFHVDYGAAVAVDALFIEKHNFNGEDITWEYSANNSDWSNAVTGWTQGDNLQIAKIMSASQTKRYWRVTVTSMENPRCSEIFISLGYSFSLKQNPTPSKNDIENVQRDLTVGGVRRSTKFGGKRKYREYSFLLSSSQLTSFETMIGLLDEYSKPFYIKDEAGSYWFANFVNPPRFDFIDSDYTRCSCQIIEEL